MPKNITNTLRSAPVLIAAALLTAYLLLAYFAVDPLAKRLLPWVAKKQLASRASVAHVSFDPLRLAFTIDGFRLARPDDAPLASFDRLQVDLESSGLFQRAWRIKDIHLTAPQVTLDVAPDGKLNWAALIAKLNEDPSPSDTLPRVKIDHIQIERGNIEYADRSRPTPFKAALTPLGLELAGLSTLPEDRGDYQIVAKLPEQGGTLKWKGDIGLNPIASNGKVEIADIRLPKLLQVVPPQLLPVQLTAGELQTSFGYRFAMVGATQDPKPEARLENLTLTLDKLQGRLPPVAGSELALHRFSLNVPELDFSMRSGLQLRWHGMDVELQDAALRLGATPLLKLPQARIEHADFDLADRHLQVAKVLLANGAVQAQRQPDGSLDWQRLFPATTADAPAAATDDKPLRFEVADVQLQHWQAAYRDMTFKQPLRLAVQDTNIGFAVANTDGDIAIRQFESHLGPLTLTSARAQQPAATLAQISLTGGEVSLKNRSAKLQALTVSGLQTQVLREADKSLNWQAMLEPAAPAPAAKTGGQAAASDWKLALNRLALTDSAVHIEDRSTGSPVQMDIQGIAAELRDATQDLAKPLPVHAQFRVKQGGEFAADGKLALAPLKGDLRLKLAALSLKPFAPYINQAAWLTLTDGSADSAGRLTLAAGKDLGLQFQGGFGVNRLAIREENGGAMFLGWQSLGSDSLQLALNPNRLHMDELRIVQPTGKVIIYEDKSVNIKRILRAQPETAPAAAGSAAPVDFPVAVERVKIENADLEFADLSLRPQFGTQINSLSGVVNGLSTSPDTTAQVELDGKVDEYGSARIRGSLQPFRATDFTDLKLAFRNLEMNRLTPYSGKFAGRKIDSGKMSVDLEYNIKHRQLSGANKFVINKLRLGERVSSPDAVNLPLDLAIALLEDSDGVIDLDLPVTGNLDDPQFSYGKVVWKAIVNVLGKIATSPFRALGHLLGISSDKLEAVAFDPGSAILTPPEQEKLKAVAQALAKRPALTLSIAPGYDPVADRKAIQESAIRRDVAQEMGLKLADGEQAGPTDLNNPKARTAIIKLAQTRSPEAKNRKLLDKFQDYFAKQPTDPAAYETMLQQLQQWVEVPDADLKALADARATAMQRQLAQADGIDAGRLGKSAAAPVSGDGRAVQLKMALGTGK